MLFNSWEFIVLLFVTLLLFYSIPDCSCRKCWQTVVFMIASAVFYAWEDWRLLILLIISCGGNAVTAIHVLSLKMEGRQDLADKWVVRAVVLNLLLLGVFKYAGFLLSSIPGGIVPQTWVQWVCSIPLPIGISFYTFHGISMVVDMNRNKVKAYHESLRSVPRIEVYGRAVRDMGLYLLMFPQLIAGPIIKAHYFWPQLKEKLFSSIDWSRACRYLITGYFFKMVVADNLYPITSLLKSQVFIEASSGVALLFMLLGYSVQIFADFAGYSMIAIGLAALFGYRFPVNFNFPYISTSLTQFWQRWNMTLSAWLKDYLYIPLGGNRKGVGRTYLNLFLVMFLGGLWHGADWKFALWGTLHGLVLALERWVQHTSWGKKLKFPQWVSILYCFIVVSALWTTFLMPDIETVIVFFRQIFTNFGAPISSIVMDQRLFMVGIFSIFIVMYHVWGWWRENKQKDQYILRGRLSYVGACVYGVMIFLIITNSGNQAGFVYFQF